MAFFVSKNGQTFGPHEKEEIAVFLGTGELGPDDHCWQEGWNDWRPISAALGEPSGAVNGGPSADDPHAPHDTAPLPPDIEIVGTLKLPDERTVTCKVEGEIISPSTVTIARGVNVKARIKARSVVIFGTVEGEVHAEERAVLKGSSILHGDIHAARVLVEEGATFKGKSHVRTQDSRPGALTAAPEKPTSPAPSNAAAESPARPA
jgi:cytoskeletal protein CcmA (bactofilin family)